MTDQPVSTCSCGEQFVYLKYVKTGKPAPITVKNYPDGNIVPCGNGHYRLRAEGEPVPAGGLPINHYANCPKWGKGKK